MARPREVLLDAAFTHGEEDRLTEIFATVLDSCDELAAALFQAVGLPVGERFKVFTQVRVTTGERPDMLVHSLDRGGAEVSHIWSEHKVGSGFGDMQRERYLTAMRASRVRANSSSSSKTHRRRARKATGAARVAGNR